jgi:deoxyribodipyrimidine photo-lyase
MHNRVRMITASFLVKDAHVDWRQGERFFAQHLTDYDPALNNGNWQWAASTGCDAQPYFRIFNPWLQQKKFDAEATYIKTWLPELIPFTAKEIHRHETSALSADYPAPIVQHGEASTIAKSLFSS